MRVLAWLGAILCGAALGAASAWAALEFGRHESLERAGQWTWSNAGADPYARAIAASDALLAPPARDVRVFSLDRDENGQPLQEACIYELAGGSLKGRWWSATLYARDGFLAANSDHAFALDSTRVAVDGRGHWAIRIAPVRGEARQWLSSRAARRGFSLTLRLYTPNDEFRAEADALPTLRTLSCPDAPA
jgi:hypothetical protein